MHGYEIEKSSIVVSFIDFQLSGNVIPGAWFKTVQRNGKAYLLAINLLADVLYWYRPIEERDEKTGKFIGYRKKFKGDVLQRSYSDWAEQFGVSKKQVIDAVRFLCTEKLLTRDVRVLRLPTRTLGGVTFFSPNKKQIDRASQSIESEEVKTPPLQIYRGTPTKKEGYPSQNVGPCTEITTETTTETSIRERKKDMSSSSNIDVFVARATEIFEYWKLVTEHPKAQFSPKRQKCVRGRLKDGFSVDELMFAIEGCKESEFHNGQNEAYRVYDDLELICRDATKVEQFIEMRFRNADLYGHGKVSGCCKVDIDYRKSCCSKCQKGVSGIETIHAEWLRKRQKRSAA